VHTTGILRQRRRRHSPEFKAESVTACRQPGVSIAAVAMSRGLNANLLRRWVVEAERGEAPARATLEPKALLAPIEAERFVPVSVTDKPASAEPRIRVEVRRGGTLVSVEWPPAAARECAQWLRKLLR
jgi:transposase-like protein